MSRYDGVKSVELVVMYNEFAGKLGEKPVKKFSSRNVGINRLNAIEQRYREQLPLEEPQKDEMFPETETVTEVPVENVVSNEHLLQVIRTITEPIPEPVAPKKSEDKVVNDTRGRKSVIDRSRLVMVNTEEGRNPKRPGTRAHSLFAMYGSDPIRISTYIDDVTAAGYSHKLAIDSVRWDLSHNFIQYLSED